ncbi:MAG: nuclear transport factor 2 family protein [Streptosporangiaceae bacterium]|nr:nuclear transport factor 2 family protein [Streptosporangiaceae bacterium]MBV9856840.1 nuclear transport factor 2 family protein [Streptosporangiaceae bacterium]
MPKIITPGAGVCGLAVRALHAMADGDPGDFQALYQPHAADHEQQMQPPSSRVPGPDGVWATARRLRAAFTGLRYDIHHAVRDGGHGRGQLHDERTPCRAVGGV